MNSRLIYFVRHGETGWNAEKRIQGQRDIPINENGRRQADRNGFLLKQLLGRAGGFDFVASPLGRTRETMERIRTAMGLPALDYRVDDRLKEIHFGSWQGFTLAELEAREPGKVAQRDASKWSFLPPGAHAESYAMLAARIRPWLDAVSRPTVCVTHGGVMRTLFNLVGDMEGDSAALLDIPQDRILELRDVRLRWR